MTRRHPTSPAGSPDDDQRHSRRDFEERWRRWAAQPPERSPQTAARQVLDRLDEGSRRWHWPRVPALATTAALVAVVVLAVGLWLGPWLGAPGLPPSVPDPDGGAEGSVAEAPVMEPGVVLMWLDAETPLYMTFAPPGTEAGAEKGEES